MSASSYTGARDIQHLSPYPSQISRLLSTNGYHVPYYNSQRDRIVIPRIEILSSHYEADYTGDDEIYAPTSNHSGYNQEDSILTTAPYTMTAATTAPTATATVKNVLVIKFIKAPHAARYKFITTKPVNFVKYNRWRQQPCRK